MIEPVENVELIIFFMSLTFSLTKLCQQENQEPHEVALRVPWFIFIKKVPILEHDESLCLLHGYGKHNSLRNADF